MCRVSLQWPSVRVTAVTLSGLSILLAISACGASTSDTPRDQGDDSEVPSEVTVSQTTQPLDGGSTITVDTSTSSLGSTTTEQLPPVTAPSTTTPTTTSTTTTVAPPTTIESQEPESQFITYQPNA